MLKKSTILLNENINKLKKESTKHTTTSYIKTHIKAFISLEYE